MNSTELILLIFQLVTATFYGIIIMLFTLGWSKLQTSGTNLTPQKRISVIIPLRNESEHLVSLIDRLLLQDYPKELYEIILVNDHSSDDTGDLLRQVSSGKNILFFELPANLQGKKQALSLGISHASGEIILTSDADCKPGKEWLNSVDAYFQKGSYKMLAGPVAIEHPTGLFGCFQSMELISLQGSGGGAIGIGMPIMCNGANLSFYKSSFLKVNGYMGNENIASGDDIFLLEKFKTAYGPASIGFMKDTTSIVYTSQASGLKAYLNQRIRWVSKSPSYSDPFLLTTSFTVLLFNLMILVCLIVALLSASKILLITALSAFVYKSVVDMPVLWKASGFFNQRSLLLRSYLILQPLHIIFIVFSGIFGNLLSYRWKGRHTA